MITKIQYSDEQERDNLIIKNNSLILIEEQNIREGNFLIFSDVPLEKQIVYTQVPQEEMEVLKQENQTLKAQLQTTQEAIDFLIMGGM